MKKLVLLCAVVLTPVQSHAGWISTLAAMDASSKASDAKRESENTAQKVATLEKKVDDLTTIVRKIAETLDKKDTEKPKQEKSKSKPQEPHGK